MKITVDDMVRWKPPKFSEDHLTNFLKQLFKAEGEWHIVYSNPPGGSWKEATLIRGNYLYRQVGPKRGVRHTKRPDIALQYLGNTEGSELLFLIEDKPSLDDWDSDLPALMEAYFEGPIGDYNKSKGIRSVPFWHKQKIGSDEWEKIQESDERTWFRDIEVDYIYGFLYSLGFVDRTTDISSHQLWMERQLRDLKENIPLVFMAVGWFRNSYEPVVIRSFSEHFPDFYAEKVDNILPDFPEDFRFEKQAKISKWSS